MKRIRIYIAGPYTKPDPVENTNRACHMWADLWECGFAPFCPHWSMLQHTIRPQGYETWMETDFIWLEQCEVLLRMPGESSGADREVAHAQKHGIPVIYGKLAEALAWRQQNPK